MSSFELLDHDADLGLSVEADSFAELLATSVAGLTACLVAPGPPGKTGPMRETRRVEATGDRAEELLVRWLKEWLNLYVTERFIAGEARVTELAEGRVAGEARGEILDPARHRILREVKAVTYHQAAVRNDQGRWRGRVIFDV